MTASSRSRRRATLAWLVLIAFAGVVLILGGEHFDASETGGLLAPLLAWLFPDWNQSQRYLLHLKIRKWAHAIEYAVLALLALRAAFLSFRTATARIVTVALAIALAVAATDETRQLFLPGRTGSLMDVMLDLTGAVVAIVLALLVRHWSRRRAGVEGAP